MHNSALIAVESLTQEMTMKRISVLAPWLLGAALGISSLLQTAMAADGLQARLSADTVGFGDTVTLMLTADADSVHSNPDLSPLQYDFNLLSQSTSSQTSIINGARNATISWVITLAPNSMGKLDIPAISAGTLSSNPISLDVVDAATLPAGTTASQDIAVDVLVDDKPHYVHGEIPITVRIIDGTGLTDASLQVPSSSDFTLKQTGNDEISQSQQDDRPVTVMQRHYLLTPLKSGELTLPAVLLQGTAPAPAKERSAFDRPALPSVFGRSPFSSSLFDSMFNPGQEVHVRSMPVTLDIKANPVSDSNWFLPAKDVKLNAVWAQQNPTFKVGEAMSRTIRLYALGAAREKLPNLDFAEADGVRLYLDRSDDKSVDTPQGTAAVREFSVSIVPTRTGEITLPAIDVNWWDTEADEQRIASLPAETISVVGGPFDNTASNDTGSTRQLANTNSPDDTVQTSESSDSAGTVPSFGSLLLWCGLTLLILMTGTPLFLLHRRARSRSLESDAPNPDASRAGSISSSSHENMKHRQALKLLHCRVIDACKANQPETAYAAFRAWYAEANPGNTLSTLSLQPHHAALSSEFDALETWLYQSEEIHAWHGKEFLDAFQDMSAQMAKRARSKVSVARVPALYPA